MEGRITFLNTTPDILGPGGSSAGGSAALKVFAAALALDTAVDVPTLVRNLRVLVDAGIPDLVRVEVLELADVMERMLSARAPAIAPRREDP